MLASRSVRGGYQAISECCWLYRQGSCARGPQGAACGGVRVRTDTAGVILLLMVVWIVFTGSSSGRSASGMAAGICCSGIFLTTSRGLMTRRGLSAGLARSAGVINARSRSSNHCTCKLQQAESGRRKTRKKPRLSRTKQEDCTLLLHARLKPLPIGRVCALALVNRITLGPLPLADQPYFLCLTNPTPTLPLPL